ncbi:glycosyltransferase family 2 protein [Candidatus Gottesmanbacteria bacterium]|nr:glycosyltransferase family 2 protein [Candidatus Gottesmanbacteria bacterium]
MKNNKGFKSKPVVSIIILTCNSYILANQCIDLVKKLTSKNYHKNIIVVDNGSKGDIVKKLAQEYPEIMIVDNKVNYGFSKGINYGIKLALDLKSNYIFLLNDDTIFDSFLMDRLIEKAENNKYLICGPQVLTKEGFVWSNGGMIDKKRFSGSLVDYGEKPSSDNKEKTVNFISGTAMLVKTSVFNKIGFLDEDYFLYYDDADFCFRAQKAGIQSIIIPSIKLIHLETVTIGKNSPSHYYHAAKSRLIFLFKHAPYWLKIREIMRLPKSILESRKPELQAYFDFFFKL